MRAKPPKPPSSKPSEASKPTPSTGKSDAAKRAAKSTPAKASIGTPPVSPRQAASQEVRVPARVFTAPVVRAKSGTVTPLLRRQNRIRRGIRRRLWGLLAVSVLLFCGVATAAVLRSPRLHVAAVDIRGNKFVSREKIYAALALTPNSNMVTLPVEKLRHEIEKEPNIERADILRVWPNRLKIVVTERQPWAWLRIRGQGMAYALDRRLIPFRQVAFDTAAKPLILIAQGKPVLGQTYNGLGMPEAEQCIVWAQKQGNYPLEQITIDAMGNLCLNRTGGAEVQLMSGLELDKKLDALARLREQRGEWVDSAEKVAYLNIVAPDSPAVFLHNDQTRAKMTERAERERNETARLHSQKPKSGTFSTDTNRANDERLHIPNSEQTVAPAGDNPRVRPRSSPRPVSENAGQDSGGEPAEHAPRSTRHRIQRPEPNGG